MIESWQKVRRTDRRTDTQLKLLGFLPRATKPKKSNFLLRISVKNVEFS